MQVDDVVLLAAGEHKQVVGSISWWLSWLWVMMALMLSDLSLILLIIKIGHHPILCFSGAEAMATANNAWNMPLAFISPGQILGRTCSWRQEYKLGSKFCSLTLIFKASEIAKQGHLGNFVCQKQMMSVKHSYWLAALMGDPIAALLCIFASRHCLPVAGAWQGAMLCLVAKTSLCSLSVPSFLSA